MEVKRVKEGGIEIRILFFIFDTTETMSEP